MLWVQLKRCVSCVWMLRRGHSGDRCVLVSTLCKYDLRKGDLFALSWARVRQGMRESILLLSTHSVVPCLWGTDHPTFDLPVSLSLHHSSGVCPQIQGYDLRMGDLFVLSWARVRRVRQGSISSELLMCGGGVHSIFLLPLVARCLETIYIYMHMVHVCFYVCCACSDCMGMFVV